MTSSGPSPARVSTTLSVGRSLIAALFIVVDIVLVLLWSSVATTTPRLQPVVTASIVTLVVGACCLVAVIVLSIRWRKPIGPSRPNRNTVAIVLSGVALLQLIFGFVAMVVAGALSDLSGSQILIGTMFPAVATVLLSVSVGRHIARTAAGDPR